MFDAVRALHAILDHLLRLLPEDPKVAKRLDDIVDPAERVRAGFQEALDRRRSVAESARLRAKTRIAS